MIRISDLGLNIYSSFGRLTFTRNKAGSHYQGAGPKDLGFTACGLVISQLYWGFRRYLADVGYERVVEKIDDAVG